jgi:hypothetical protein
VPEQTSDIGKDEDELRYCPCQAMLIGPVEAASRSFIRLIERIIAPI